MRASARLGQVLATIGFAYIARALFLSEGTVRNHLSAPWPRPG
jgi:hypothetical protein